MKGCGASGPRWAQRSSTIRCCTRRSGSSIGYGATRSSAITWRTSHFIRRRPFLLVLILRRLAVPGALFAGLIFALHPVCVESVAWISEQKNTLSAVFYLASAYVYLRFVENARVRLKADTTDAFRSAGYWVSFALFVCALLSKTVTASLPAALLLVLWWQRGRLDWRRDVLPLVPVVCDRSPRRRIHCLVRARRHRRERRRLHAFFRRAAAPRRPCRLVLSCQAVLAPQSHLHLSAMGHRRVGVVAVPLSCRRHCDGDGPRHAGEAPSSAQLRRTFGWQARTARGISVFLRNARSCPRVRRRVSLPFFVRRRSFSVSREPRGDRSRCRRSRDRG